MHRIPKVFNVRQHFLPCVRNFRFSKLAQPAYEPETALVFSARSRHPPVGRDYARFSTRHRTNLMVEATVTYEGELHCRAVHGPSQSSIETDAPADNMGRGERFSPTDLVGTALATCVLTTMAIMGTRNGVQIAGATARVRKFMTSEPPRRIARLEVDISLPLSPDHPHRARLEAAASGCPVKRSLHPDVEVVETFAWTGA